MSFSNRQEQGKPVAIKDEGITIASAVQSIDFVGSGVSGSALGQDVTENITGTGTALTPADDIATDSGDHTNFTISHSPNASSLIVVYNSDTGQIYSPSLYSISGTTVTFTSSLQTEGVTPIIRVKYAY